MGWFIKSKPKPVKDDTTIPNAKIADNGVTSAHIANNAVRAVKIMKNYRYPIDDYIVFDKDQWVLTPDRKLGIVYRTIRYPSNNILITIVKPNENAGWTVSYYSNELIKVPSNSNLKTVLTLYGKSVKKDKWPIK